MTNPTGPGWYDDPDDPGQLRYFDGILWTAHTTPRRTAPAPQPAPQPSAQASAQPAPQPTVPGPTPPTTPGATPGAQPPATWAPPGALPPPPGDPTAYPRGGAGPYGSGPGQHPGGPGPGQYPGGPGGYPGYPGGPAGPPGGPAPYPWQAPRVGPSTDDGVPLASYVQRVGAFLLDYLVTAVLSGIVGGWFAWQAVQPLLSRLEGLTSTSALPPVAELTGAIDRGPLVAFIAVQLLVGLFYEAFFLTRYGATPGKLLVGISVRRVGRPGVLGWDAAIRRAGFQTVLAALRNVPLLSFPALLATVLNYVWPLADARRQAGHDKVADTVVVRGRQPR
ncbi:MAG TPA: RDD family protein [Dermatophilaceae bacterium]|nr:RDD family protein [Dermatophilaceae bacterium]